MANTAAAKKEIRASTRRALRNRAVRSAVKTRISRGRRALTTEAPEQAAELTVAAISSLDRAAAAGILHRNNAGRRKSRLQKRLNAALAGQLTQEPTKGTRGRAATADRSAKAGEAAPAPKKPAAKRTRRSSSS